MSQILTGIVLAMHYQPSAADAFDSAEAEAAISRATREADEAGIVGPAATPWLLRRINELTAGRSLQANVSLLKNNGRIAGQIAASLTTGR